MPDELNSENTWDWNCGPKNDLDYRIIWGEDGTLTIQRNQLRKIHYSLKCWNPLDGWVEESREQVVNPPTSELYTFYRVLHLYAFARGEAPQYWGRRYTMEGRIIVISGPEQKLVDEEVVTTVQGCFIGDDPHYIEIF